MAKKIEKQFYSISEVSKLTGVSQPCLRSWETEVSQLNPRRSSGGTRIYVQKDIDVILTIKKLLDNDGYTLSGVKDKLKHLDFDKAQRQRQVIEKLQSIRADLVEIRHELNLTEALAKTIIVPGDIDIEES
ncbi:MAG: MerR family transcriptional regulator [Bacteroidales bacterium]|nr:MerR family transcriptional regulator [Bacteroidales bacterium]